MRRLLVPFSVPSKLEAELARVRAYWEGLKRGGAGMPFWDDVNLAALPGLSGRLMLLDVFDKPLRFRFGIVGEELKARYRADVSPAGSRMSSKSVIHSSTSILKPLPRSRVVPRHITATRRPSAASLARKRDMLGSFSTLGRRPHRDARWGCRLGIVVSPGSARIATPDTRPTKVQISFSAALCVRLGGRRREWRSSSPSL